MQDVTIGRIVHFVQQLPGQVGTGEYAAIISRVYTEHRPEDYPRGSFGAASDPHNDGDVCLHVFMETRPVVVDSVSYSSDKLPNTWHWIEKA